MLVTPTDIDYLTVSLNAGETLTLIGTPTTPSLQLVTHGARSELQRDRLHRRLRPRAQDAVIETAAGRHDGNLHDRDLRCNGNVGQYSIQATLNAFVKTGTSNDTIGTAQDLTGTSYGLGSGGADRLGAVGSLPSQCHQPR